MGKNRQPPAFQKMKCLPPWALFFWSTHHNIMPHKVPCNNTKKKKRKRKKSNQDFMNPFEAHSHLFLCLNLAFSTTSLPMLQSSNSLSWCIISCSMTVGGNAVTIASKAPLAVTKPSELAGCWIPFTITLLSPDGGGVLLYEHTKKLLPKLEKAAQIQEFQLTQTNACEKWSKNTKQPILKTRSTNSSSKSQKGVIGTRAGLGSTSHGPLILVAPCPLWPTTYHVIGTQVRFCNIHRETICYTLRCLCAGPMHLKE